ncbi:MAG: hypothetical protein HQL12_04980 [Candidatus Omnitrophica bacterium]|nr:hypothetical protein [Candidatus Omnitrophota bacterium]
MFKVDPKKAQAVTELAVFGAVLIFLIGTIVRTAVGNSYVQNQNFKAMRMAMLASWNDSKANPNSLTQVTAHNSGSVLFVEDRLSPDSNKYGDLDRTPYIAQGSGTFSYNLMYPVDQGDVNANLPIMDVYINGQHFPFATASFVKNQPITRPADCGYAGGGPYTPSVTQPMLTPQQCLQNQCLRQQREWAGGTVRVSSFDSIIPVTGATAPLRTLQAQNNACTIFSGLAQAQIFSPNPIANPGYLCQSTTFGKINPDWSSHWSAFVSFFPTVFPSITPQEASSYESAIKQILQGVHYSYKLFYNMSANFGGSGVSIVGAPSGTPLFSTIPPTCSSHPCKNAELSAEVVLTSTLTNANADMQFDLMRNGDYATVKNQPSSSLRPFMAWQWYATGATSADMIGLDASNSQYPQWDIDGRLKEVTVYNISNSNGATTVDYEDPDGGDIDGGWDVNSCTPKPGLQTPSEILTFTQGGTYLQIKEGKLYNPETGQVVRSANKRNNLDIIQRTIQLSNNTGRFCTTTSPTKLCASGCANPNPVEVCVDASGSCFSSDNIAKTCYDIAKNMIFVRSRLQDLRGTSWITRTGGQLQVH